MTLPNLNWGDLITGLLGVVIGWLANILNPAPGTQRKARK